MRTYDDRVTRIIGALLDLCSQCSGNDLSDLEDEAYKLVCLFSKRQDVTRNECVEAANRLGEFALGEEALPVTIESIVIDAFNEICNLVTILERSKSYANLC